MKPHDFILVASPDTREKPRTGELEQIDGATTHSLLDTLDDITDQLLC